MECPLLRLQSPEFEDSWGPVSIWADYLNPRVTSTAPTQAEIIAGRAIRPPTYQNTGGSSGSTDQPPFDYSDDGNLSLQPCDCSNGDPVDDGTGGLAESFQDLLLPGRGIPLAFDRTYNSFSASQDGPLGFGWTDNYQAHATSDGGGGAVVYQENGTSVHFFLTPSGTYAPPSRDLASLVQNEDGSLTFTRDVDQTPSRLCTIGFVLRCSSRCPSVPDRQERVYDIPFIQLKPSTDRGHRSRGSELYPLL